MEPHKNWRFGSDDFPDFKWMIFLGEPAVHFRGCSLGCPPSQDAIVTTRIITFLVGDPELNLHLPQESWEGGTTQGVVNQQLVNIPLIINFWMMLLPPQTLVEK